MKPKVYFTKTITPDSLVQIYKALDAPLEGKVGVKISLGEPGNNNYLHPELIGKLVKKLGGTIIECNTAYGGGRGDTASHQRVFRDHGFDQIAELDIMDANGAEIKLTTTGGILPANYVGKHLENYDGILNLAHFKGHGVAGFGGVIKNQSIGIASRSGKAFIHTVGRTRSAEEMMEHFGPTPPQDYDIYALTDDFQKAMAESAKSVADYLKHQTSKEHPIVYINVLNNLSRDCDCDAEPEAVHMQDIGIVASLDPVAVDQAAMDLIYSAEDAGRDAFVERIESQNAKLMLEHAAEIGFGSREYELVKLD